MKALVDLHTHTLVSGHAYSTIKENVESAKLAGLKYIGLSEHAPNMPAAPHAYYFQNVHVIPKEIDGVKVKFTLLDYCNFTDKSFREFISFCREITLTRLSSV